MSKRRYVCDETLQKDIASMYPSKRNKVSKATALENQGKFAEAWSDEINDIIGFEDDPNRPKKVVIDLATAQKILKGETVEVQAPVRPEIYPGNIVTDIFTIDILSPGQVAEYPIDYTADPDSYNAIYIPDDGRLPERIAVTDSVWVRTFRIGNSAYWKASFATRGNALSIAKGKNRFNAGFINKINDIGWHAMLGACADRNVKVQNTSATSGTFTRGLLTSMARSMRRLGGGNDATQNAFKLTDIFVPVESMENILNWTPSDVGDFIVTELIRKGYNTINFHGINIHIMDELGYDSTNTTHYKYQDYLVNTLGVTITSGSRDFCIGLDMSKRDNFVMPVAESIQIHPDETVIPKQRMGFYGFAELGAAVLDTRAVILGVI